VGGVIAQFTFRIGVGPSYALPFMGREADKRFPVPLAWRWCRMWRKLTPVLVLVSMVAAGCGVPAESAASYEAKPAPPATVGTCALSPVAQPLMPEDIPGYTEIDPETGLHMTGTPVLVDLSSWRLEVTGKVDHPLSLTYDQLRCLPKVEEAVEMICPGLFVDHAGWAGTPLSEILDLAGIQQGASEVNLIAADGYSSTVDLSSEVLGRGFLAYELEGKPLPVLHGFPVRAVFPGRDGNTWTKWIVGIEVG
jgi:DMSO/TMAO reductase YedYZ molybdopterin-dependent catalytic subunit